MSTPREVRSLKDLLSGLLPGHVVVPGGDGGQLEVPLGQEGPAVPHERQFANASAAVVHTLSDRRGRGRSRTGPSESESGVMNVTSTPSSLSLIPFIVKHNLIINLALLARDSLPG